jgi:hypothetical protein
MSYRLPYLQKYDGPSSRFTCPQCKTPHSFTRYIDGETEQPIHPTVGKCNRVVKCGYHYTPKQYFLDHPHIMDHNTTLQKTYTMHSSNTLTRPQPSFIPFKYVKASASYNSNFVLFLCRFFSKEQIMQAVEDYAIGATKQKEVIFWQMDIHGKFRTGKIMQYNPDTGKRVKNQNDAINWVHALLKKTDTQFADFNLCQCYFGEHLLRLYPHKPIAIVESEKTAVIASILLPDYNWLATGGLNGLNIEKSRTLQGRTVVLYPDAGCYALWKNKMQEIKTSIQLSITISNLVETTATPAQIEEGYDIADFLIRSIDSNRLVQDVSITPKYSPTLQKMIEINPAVQSLIVSFDLEEVSS